MGTKACAKFSTKDANTIWILQYSCTEQAWQKIDLGSETAYKVISGGIFEFSFSDAILQMWAAYLYELENKKPPSKFSGCMTPSEVALSHRLFTAALESHKNSNTEKLKKGV